MSPINEDELRARLRDVSASPSVPGYAEVLVERAQARRRRQRWVSGLAVAAAVATVALGALMVGDRFGRDDALPATPTPTPTYVEPTPTVSPTSTPSATGTPSATSSPTSTPSPSPTPTSASPSATPTRTPAPAPVRLLHDGRSDWSPADLEIPLCVGEARVFPSPGGRNDMRVIRADFVPGANSSEGLIVFPSAAEAVGYLADVRRVARGCTDESSDDTKVVVDRVDGPWGEGLSVASAGRQIHDGTPRWTGLGVTVFARVGAAVALGQYGSKAELTDESVASHIAQLRPALEYVAPQLCRYTKSGC
jgi:hypothetical protein